MKKAKLILLTILAMVFTFAVPASDASAAAPEDIKIPVTIDLEGVFPETPEDYIIHMQGDTAETPMPEGTVDDIYTMTITGEGTDYLPTIVYNKVGVYNYTIWQEAGTNAKATYDSSVYHMTITITNNDAYDGYEATVAIRKEGVDGKLDEILFVNTYIGSVDVDLDALKLFNGHYPIPGTFGFVLLDDQGKVVEVTVNELNGKIHFDNLTFEEPGVYHYKLVEVIGADPTVVYDGTVYDVTIIVTLEDGEYVTETIITAYGKKVKAPIFYNHTRKPVDVDIDAEKFLDGKLPADDFFDFVLVDKDGNVIQTVTNDRNGNIDFEELTFALPGIYTYTVKEVIGTDEGIVYDDTEYEVTFIVTPNLPTIDGYHVETIVKVDGEVYCGPLVFNNTTRTPADVELDADKLMDGAIPEVGDFEFTLTDEEGNVVETVTTDENGNIVFDELTFDKSGTYKYTIKEVIGADESVVYYDSVYEVVIEVTANEPTVDGYTVNVTITKDGEPYEGIPVFNNTSRTPAEVGFAAEKLLDDKAPEAGAFEFVLVDEEGNILQTVANDAEGTILFEALTFDQSGTYNFTVKEVIGTDDKIIYDKTVYEVVVEVTANAATEDGYTVETTITADGKEVKEMVFKNETVVEKPEDPKTGDNSNITMYLIMMAVAVVAIVAVIVKRKMNK